MAILTHDQIMNAEDVQIEEVKVPEWGGEVMVRGMTGRERDKFEADSMKGRGKGRDVDMANFRARLCARCMVDEAGNRLFADSEVSFLGNKSAAALQRVFNKAMELCGMRDEDVDELVGNSPDEENDGSTSD